jgi:CelD/BcsL family acetyltransferase involved in cellulose biosynthesis
VTVNIALFDDLDAVAADAGGALDRVRVPSLFGRLDWFRLLQAHCPPAGRLLAVRARDGERGAWLFLAIEGKRAKAYAAWYSLRFDAVGNRDPDLLTAIAKALKAERLAAVSLAPMIDPKPLKYAFRAAGWAARAVPKTGNWLVRTEGQSFDAYWEQRPAKLRNTAKRKAKAAALDIVVHDCFDAATWADYEAVYRASWKPEEGSFPFLRALAEQEGAAGTLRLGIARKDGRPVAAQLWLIEAGEATIHKLAYAEDAKPLSPGTVLGEAMFRRALVTDKVSVIDYGTGDDGYKRDWMEERRVLWQLDAFNPATLSGLAGAARAEASKLVGRIRSR